MSYTYIAFLLGVNVGGHRKVPMVVLRDVLSSIGFENVRTLLNSGNVVLESLEISSSKVGHMIENAIEKQFGFGVGVIVRTMSDLQNLITADPFRNIVVTSDTRLYVTFLSEIPHSTLQFPYDSEDSSFKILEVRHSEVFSVLKVSSNKGTTDGMRILGKAFGKKITTRNWNTIVKLSKF